MKNIYVYFSDPDYLRDFRDHPDFIHPAEYNSFEAQKMSQLEYGKLKILPLFLKLIYDNGFSHDCPWCGFPGPVIKVEDRRRCDERIKYLHPIQMFAECQQCKARGPSLNIMCEHINDRLIFSEYKSMVRQRWAARKPKKFESTNE